jgi:hypothetical protein
MILLPSMFSNFHGCFKLYCYKECSVNKIGSMMEFSLNIS